MDDIRKEGQEARGRNQIQTAALRKNYILPKSIH
jgi:hypothetical protein